MPRRPLTPREQKARAAQLENDTAALHLVRQAASLEGRAAKLAASGIVTASAVAARAATFRAVAARLVLTKRPASLGVPRWIQREGMPMTVTPLIDATHGAGGAMAVSPSASTEGGAAE